MPPGGPRARRPEAAPSPPPTSSRAPVDRNDAFKSIFGRPAAGHHMGGAHPPPPSQHQASNWPAQPGMGTYDAYAPPLPPVDPYSVPGPSNYHGYDGGGHGQVPGPPHQRAVGGPRDQRGPSNGGMGYPGTAGIYDGIGNGNPTGHPRERRTSNTPSVAPSLAYSVSSASQPNLNSLGGSQPQNGMQPSRTPYRNPTPTYQERPRTTSAQASMYPSAHPQHSQAPPPRVDSRSLGRNNRYPQTDNQGMSSASPYPAPNQGGDTSLTPAQQYQMAEGYGYTVPSPSSSEFPRNDARYQPRQVSGASTITQSRITPSGHRFSEDPEPTGQFDDITPPPTYSSHDGLAELAAGPPTPSGAPRLPEIVSPDGQLGLLEQFEGLAAGSRSGRVFQEGEGTTQSRGYYEEESRDRVTPVQSRPDGYSHRLNHRRQMSDSSVVSSSTIQSNYQQRNYNNQGLSIDIADQYRDHSPELSSPAGYGSESALQSASHRLSARTSSDSMRSLPQVNAGGLVARSSLNAGSDRRSGGMSGTGGARDAMVSSSRSGSLGHNSRYARPAGSGTPTQANLNHSTSASNSVTSLGLVKRPLELASHGMKLPTVYPALLSRVAEVFRQGIILGDRVKDGLTYKDSFDGRGAVELIAEIIRTSDRNLALLLGRALDAQKFFHDVTYDHRLRDSALEIYRFRERLPSPFVPGGGQEDVMASPTSEPDTLPRQSPRPSPRGYSSGSLTMTAASTQSSHSNVTSANPTPNTSSTTLNLTTSTSVKRRRGSDDSMEDSLPVGVFTLLTDCYSPTCTRDQLCYSINCPRRLEQQKRLNLKPEPGLNRKLSQESLDEVKETGTLWIHSVSQDVVNSVSEQEQRRQEAINELIYTERDFVRDLEYLRESWIKPLRTLPIIPGGQPRREDFVTQVFWNCHEILAVNSVLAERLTKRQKQASIVSSIGDVLLEHVTKFEPFVSYGAHQLFGKYEFEKQKGSNPAFQKFVDETERDPASRKLELNGYLTKPTTRLARYPLLLEVIAKYTAPDHPDQEDLAKAVKIVRGFLTRVNTESGKSENMFNLAQLDQQLVFRPGETFDLHLRDKNRELVYKGPLKYRGNAQTSENADLTVFLFDHALLLVKSKWINKHEQYKVYRKPIPLELLMLTSPDESHNSARLLARGGKATLPRTNTSKSSKEPIPKPESKHGYSLTLNHLGKKGYTMTLWAPTYVGRKKWLEHIDGQQQILRDESRVFDTSTITDAFFRGLNKLNCAAPYDGGRRMIYGTDDGVYFSNLRDDKLKQPTKVLALPDVTQVDVLEEFQLLVVLAERSVTTFPLEALDPTDPTAALKRGKRLSSHTSFFKSGICLGRTLLCIVKSSTLSSTIKTLEPVDMNMRGKKQPTPFRKLLNGSNEPFKVFKEFYIPTESSGLSFLKTKLCVATTRGFEVVDLETLDTQGLLDPSDASLDFVSRRENVRPIAIYRVEDNFLLCYSEFAFYVNKTGWRARPRWVIHWEGFPTAFALHYPYVLAFEPTFVEVRHVESGNLVQIVTGNNIRCLFADTPPSTVNAPPTNLPPQFRSGGPAGPPNRNQFAPQQNPYAYNTPPPQPPYGQMAPPINRVNVRNQIIFVSDEGHVQVVRLAASSLSSAPSIRDSTGSSGGGGSFSRR